jgi:hypothetical protein
MKGILRAIFFSAVIALSLIVAVPVGIIIIWMISTNECNYYTVDILPSPTGVLSLARVEKRCSRDEDAPPMMFALLHPGEQIESRRSADYEGTTSGEYLGAGPPLSIFAKWIDERNLVVAAPEGSTLKKGKNNFRVVHIQYSFWLR